MPSSLACFYLSLKMEILFYSYEFENGNKFSNCKPEAKKLEKGEKSHFDKLVLYHSVASRERRWIWVKTFFDPTGYDDMNLASSIFMMKKDKSLPWQHGASC